MGKMRQGTGSRSMKRPGGPGPRDRTPNRSESLLTKQNSDREDPLDVPQVLLRAAGSPLTDMLGVIIEYIDALPPRLTELFTDAFDSEQIDDLRIVHQGLLKLRANVMPSRDE